MLSVAARGLFGGHRRRMAGRAVSANDIQLAAQGVNVLGPVFWLWGIAIIFQTLVFGALGAWGVSRFINKLIAEIRKEIAEAVKDLTAANENVKQQTGDSVAAMRQHVQNMERCFEQRCHAIEKKALEDRNHDLEFFARRESVRDIAEEMRDGFEKVSKKIDEIRDRKVA